MRIFNNDDTTQTSQYVQHDWPEIRYTTGTHNSYEYMDEYICIRYSTSLQCSKPKMPDQACANNLNLDDIPQDLTELSTMERRLISYRLPFMTLIAMKRYGGHYKVNGPSEYSGKTGPNSWDAAMNAKWTTVNSFKVET